MRVAAVQVRAENDKPANLARLSRLAGDAAARGAELVVFPEASMHGFGRPDEALAPIAEPLDGPFVTGLADAAARNHVTLIAGMFETVPEDPTRAYNTVVALG